MAKIVFCQRVVFAFFGTMGMSAVLKQHGHQVELILQSDVEKVVAELLAINPDLVGFSTLVATGEFEWATQIAQQIKAKNKGIITIFGGLHPTLYPEESLKENSIDIICRGEGEYALLALCNHLDQGKDYSQIHNLWVKNGNAVVRNPLAPFEQNLDVFPFPDRELYQKYNYFSNLDSTDVQSGRFCPYNCNFCYNHVVKTLYQDSAKIVRKHSVDYMIKQFRDIQNRYQPKNITFQDELFAMDKKWLAEFSEKYSKQIGLPFVCSVRADSLDQELAEILATAGASSVCLGLETGNEILRKEILNKPITNKQLVESAQILRKHNIAFLTANMLGIPGETLNNAWETVELNQKMKADYPYASIFQPYPKLKITKNAIQMKVLAPLEPSDYHSTFLKDSLLNQKDIEEIVNLHKMFFFAVKFPWLKPLIRQLIKLPANIFFESLIAVSYGWIQLKCFRRSPVQLFSMGIGNLKVFWKKESKQKKKGKAMKIVLLLVLCLLVAGCSRRSEDSVKKPRIRKQRMDIKTSSGSGRQRIKGTVQTQQSDEQGISVKSSEIDLMQ